jgi:hypothetical protein
LNDDPVVGQLTAHLFYLYSYFRAFEPTAP